MPRERSRQESPGKISNLHLRVIPGTEVAYKIKHKKQKQILQKGECKFQIYHITKFKYSLFNNNKTTSHTKKQESMVRSKKKVNQQKPSLRKTRKKIKKMMYKQNENINKDIFKNIKRNQKRKFKTEKYNSWNKKITSRIQ